MEQHYIASIRKKTQVALISKRDACLRNVIKLIEDSANAGISNTYLNTSYSKEHIKYIKEYLIEQGFKITGTKISW
jgi:hypothetical protein